MKLAIILSAILAFAPVQVDTNYQNPVRIPGPGGNQSSATLTHSFGRSFDGSTQSVQSSTSIAFSSTTTLTIWFWVARQSGIGSDALCMESSPNVNSNTGAFFVDCSPSFGPSAGIAFDFNNGTNVFSCQPSSTTDGPAADGTWHSIMFVIGIGANPNTCTYYMDGTSRTVTLTNQSTATGTIATNVVNVASRNQASLFCKCNLSDIAIWKASESSSVSNLNAGTVLPSGVDAGNLVSYFAMCAASGNESDKIGAWNWVLTGTLTRITASGTNINCP